MLTLTPAQRPRRDKPRPTLALAIAGGGPLGAIYELGALQALDEAIEGTRMHELDVYIGVSSGAVLSANLANRISTTQIARVFMGDPQAELRFRPEHFLRPAVREYLDRARQIPAITLEVLGRALRKPSSLASLESLEGLSRLLPTGLFDNRSIDRYLRKVFEKPGRSNDFRTLDAALRIIAVELETGRAVRFGETGLDHVPISQAVQASAALPGLYPPVEIDDCLYVDGALRRTLNASAALDQGADLLFAINPLVPYSAPEARADKPGPRHRMISGGLPVVLSQTFRSLIQSRMQIGMRKYENSYPHAAIMLVEPDRGDDKLFYTNVFSYSSRSELIEHVYQLTRRELLQHADAMDALLEPFDLGVDRKSLRREQSFMDSLAREPVISSTMGSSLSRALDKLERLV